MKSIRVSSALSAMAVLMLVSGASAAPKVYVFTGKLTSSRGTMINIPQVALPRAVASASRT